MFTKTEMKFVPSTELPMLKIPWIRVALKISWSFCPWYYWYSEKGAMLVICWTIRMFSWLVGNIVKINMEFWSL